MKIIFISSGEIKSERWLSAFNDAKVITATEYSKTMVNSDCLVWLMLEENWQETLESCLASGAKVIAMTLTETVKQAHELVAAGASGYIHALASTELLVQVEEVVTSGGAWLGASLLRQLALSFEPPSATINKRSIVLTDRERAVATCVAAGKSNKEVAEELDITERTVKAHLSACYNKMNVRDRVQLVLIMNQ